MVDEEELRARIAARIASRRAAEPGTSDEDAQGHNDRVEASSADAPMDDHEPLESGQPAPRFLEPVRPWLDSGKPGTGSVDGSAGSAADATPEAGHPADTHEHGEGGRSLDPIRPWQVRNPAPSAGGPPRPAPPSTPPPAADAPEGGSAHPLQPIRPWLYQRPAESSAPSAPSSPPATSAPRRPPATDPPRRERPESRLLPPVPSTPTGPPPTAQQPPIEPPDREPPQVEPPHVEPPARSTHHAADSSEHKRRWRRHRDEVDDDESMADWLAPTDAGNPDPDTPNTDTAPDRAAEPAPMPTLDPVPTVDPVAAPEPASSTDDAPLEESEEARQGRLRRALDWLLEPADPANPATDEDETFDDPLAADDETRVLPRVYEPIAEPPVADAVQQPVAEPSVEPVVAPDAAEPVVEPGAAEPIVFTPGADLARRLAAAHAAAKDRARTAPPVAPEDEDEDAQDDASHEDRAPVHSPLVTGAAFARRRAAAADSSADDAGTDDDVPDVRKRPHRALHRLIVLVVVVAFAGAAALLLRAFVVAPYYIPSASMEPTLHGCSGCNNDHVLVNKLSYRVHGIHRGDVVVFHRPKAWQVSDKILIKRVIGVPGDVLTTRKGIVYIDGLQLEEPYLDTNCKGGTVGLPAKSVKVAPDTAFVMGDNRCDSSDSRRFGAIPESSVIGRAFVTIWPLGRIHWL